MRRKYANERLRQVPIDKAFEGAFKTAWSRQKMSGQSSVDTTFIKTVYKDTGNVEMPFDFINRIGKLAQVGHSKWYFTAALLFRSKVRGL